MRFLPKGPDVPDRLITAQERGEVLFVCGAGVSMSAGLGSFRGLVVDVYAFLHETWKGYPAEEACMEEGGRMFAQYDRVLRCLERRLIGGEPQRSARIRDQIRNAIQQALRADGKDDLDNHLTLLELSRDQEGSPRLVTTNFDTLFERAWYRSCGAPIATHAGPAMPQPRASGFHGVMHLHGRLRDEIQELNAVDTALVLTSAEFGEAYLRSGWTSRYIYDLARSYTVVLVGYSAEDPPMRYLLEVLEADRERFSDLQPVYAFADAKRRSEPIEAALWRAKGVEPILYNSKGGDHSKLYETLKEWRHYSENPTSWRRAALKALLRRNPKKISSSDLETTTSHLKHGDCADLLGILAPKAEWLETLLSNSIIKYDGTRAGPWIAARIDDPAMIRACIRLNLTDREARWHVERALRQSSGTMTVIRREAWRRLLAIANDYDQGHLSNAWHDEMASLASGTVNAATRDLIAKILQPRLSVERPFSGLFTKKGRNDPETLGDLLRFTFKSAEYPDRDQILTVFPNDASAETALFGTLSRALSSALEEAEDAGLTEGFDVASADVPSIAPHVQNAHHRGFYPLIHVMGQIWSRLASKVAHVGKALVHPWSESRFLLERRFYLFSLASKVFYPSEAALGVIALDDATFWSSAALVEIMRLLVARWGEYSDDERKQIETRIAGGPPKALFHIERFAQPGEWELHSDSMIHRRLIRLTGTGIALAAEAMDVLNGIRERRPEWSEPSDDTFDFSVRSEFRWGGQDGDPGLLADTPDDKLIATAMEIQQSQRMTQSDLWQVFVQSDPDRALKALVSEYNSGSLTRTAWQDYLSELVNADRAVQILLAQELLLMPVHLISEISDDVCSWLYRGAGRLNDLIDAERTILLALWDKLADLTYLPAGESRVISVSADVRYDVVSEPGGELAGILVNLLPAAGEVRPYKFPAEFPDRFTRAVTAPGKAGLMAVAMFISEINRVQWHDESWTIDVLLPYLSWTNRHALVLWRAISWNQYWAYSSTAFNLLKPALLVAFEHRGFSYHEWQGLIQPLIDILLQHRRGLAGDFRLNAAEVRHALAISPMETRQNVSWLLWNRMSEDNDREPNRGRRWLDVVGPVFREIWPLNAALRNEQISQNLVHMAQNCEDGFPDAVDAILDHVVPYQLWELKHSLRLEPRFESLIKLYPKAYLRLASALIDPNSHPVPPDIPQLLEDCRNADPTVETQPAYVRLRGLSIRVRS